MLLKTVDPLEKRRLELKTENIQKRKLIIYRAKKEKTDEEGEFSYYIDFKTTFLFGVAFDSELTTEDIQYATNQQSVFVKVDKEFVDKALRRKDLEITFNDVQDDYFTEIGTRSEEKEPSFFSIDTSELTTGLYGIGIHEVGTDLSNPTLQKKIELAQSILVEGLRFDGRWKTVLSTIVSRGTNNGDFNLEEALKEYRLSPANSDKVSIVVAAPTVIICEVNGKEERLFLGFPEADQPIDTQQYEEQCILDYLCQGRKGHDGEIPSAFILGYYIEEMTGQRTFIPNPSHFSRLSPLERGELYENYKRILDNPVNSRLEKCGVLEEKAKANDMNGLLREMQSPAIPYEVISSLLNAMLYYNENESQIPRSKLLKGRRILDSSPKENHGSSNRTGSTSGLRRIILGMEQAAKGREMDDHDD